METARSIVSAVRAEAASKVRAGLSGASPSTSTSTSTSTASGDKAADGDSHSGSWLSRQADKLRAMVAEVSHAEEDASQHSTPHCINPPSNHPTTQPPNHSTKQLTATTH